MDVSPKGVCLGNINSNMIFNFRLYQKSNDKSFNYNAPVRWRWKHGTSRSYWPWLNTQFKDKCNFWANPHKMEITLFLLQCMIIGTKLCFHIHSNNTDWMRYQLFWSDITARNYDMLNFLECCTFCKAENRPIVFIKPKYLYLS